jgi:predicted metalloprotease
MPLLNFINRLLLVAGLFISGLFIFAENNFAKEAGKTVADPPRQISSDERKDISGTVTETPAAGEATEADIETMMGKLVAAGDLLDRFWRENFAGQNLSYTSPKTVAYTGRVNTLCGVIRRGTAAYCPRSHTIYFDVNFFDGMMKLTAANLNSDGDMAVIAVLAHEWAHAIQSQTRTSGKPQLMNELQADCLSGAFARYATEKGVLEEGDTKEAAFAFALGGDNSPWNTRRTHGDSRMRVGSFSIGFQQGITGCRV